jgi:hypothetical protein
MNAVYSMGVSQSFRVIEASSHRPDAPAFYVEHKQQPRGAKDHDRWWVPLALCTGEPDFVTQLAEAIREMERVQHAWLLQRVERFV